MKMLVALAFFCLLVPSLAVKGVDISVCATITLAELQCMVNSGYDSIVIQAWRGGLGLVSRIGTCVDMAYQAGFTYVDVYIYLCPECSGNNPPTDMANTMAALALRVNYYWLDIEGCGGGCWTNPSNDVAFLHSAVSAFQAKGLPVGIYSSLGSWEVMGSTTAFNTLPLWYAHFDGTPSFADSGSFATFGGWTSTPLFKQYVGDTTLCGVGVDLDYAPALPTGGVVPPPVPLPAGCIAEYKTTTDVNFRDSPSTTGNVLATLPEGTSVFDFTGTTTAADGYNWRKVQYNSQNGYCADEFLQKSRDCNPPPPPVPDPLYCVTAEPNLRLRSAACTTASVLNVLPFGATVDSLSTQLTTACGYNWRHVSYQGTTGYAADSFLKACNLGRYDVMVNGTDPGSCMNPVALLTSVGSSFAPAIFFVAMLLVLFL